MILNTEPDIANAKFLYCTVYDDRGNVVAISDKTEIICISKTKARVTR